MDVKEGITTTDFFLAQWLRRRNLEKISEETLKLLNERREPLAKKIILVANKCEYEYDGDIYRDIYKLGFGEPIFVSAEQGDGLQDLLIRIDSCIPEKIKEEYRERVGKRREKQEKIKEKLKREILEVQRLDSSKNTEGFFFCFEEILLMFFYGFRKF